MKKLSFCIIYFIFLINSWVYCQSKPLYFKAKEAYTAINNSAINLEGPFPCSSIVFIDAQKKEITFFDLSAKVYNIIKTSSVSNQDQDLNINYTATDGEGSRISLTVVKMGGNYNVIYMNTDGTGLTRLVGQLKKVF